MGRWVTLSLVLLSACSKQTGVLDASGFRAADDTYAIAFGELDGWTVENFADHKQKTGDAYRVPITWTTRTGNTTNAKIPLVDLRLTHGQSNGVIWARVIPIPHDLRDKSLGVLVENYANGVSGGAFVAGSVASPLRLERHGTVIVDSRPAGIGGFLAHSVTFDIVNLDQLQVGASAPRTRVAIVLVGVDLKRRVVAGVETSYLLLGYANDLPHFDAQAKDFGVFVKSVTFDATVRAPFGLPPTAPRPAAQAPAPLPQEQAPIPGCVPGATQACVGPGGCSGGQACAEDGRRYQPCDCGSSAPVGTP